MTNRDQEMDLLSKSMATLSIPGMSISQRRSTYIKGVITCCLPHLYVVNNYFIVKHIHNPHNLPCKIGSKVSLNVRWPFNRACRVISAHLEGDDGTFRNNDDSLSNELTLFENFFRVGRISSFSSENKTGMVDNIFHFNSDQCSYGYDPYDGDWVQIELDKNGNVLNVVPNRIGQIVGRIRWYNPKMKNIGTIANCALIDSSINKVISSIDNYTCFANVIERSQTGSSNNLDRWKQRFSWRVIQIVPIDDYSLIKDNFDIKGCFYWAPSKNEESCCNIIEVNNEKPFDVAIEPANDTMFDVMSKEGNKLTIRCHLSDKSNYGKLILNCEDQKVSIDLLCQTEFNFYYPQNNVSTDIGRCNFKQFDNNVESMGYDD